MHSTEQDAVCLARYFQQRVFHLQTSKGLPAYCELCKYRRKCACVSNGEITRHQYNIMALLRKLQDETGIYLGFDEVIPSQASSEQPPNR